MTEGSERNGVRLRRLLTELREEVVKLNDTDIDEKLEALSLCVERRIAKVSTSVYDNWDACISHHSQKSVKRAQIAPATMQTVKPTEFFGGSLRQIIFNLSHINATIGKEQVTAPQLEFIVDSPYKVFAPIQSPGEPDDPVWTQAVLAFNKEHFRASPTLRSFSQASLFPSPRYSVAVQPPTPKEEVTPKTDPDLTPSPNREGRHSTQSPSVHQSVHKLNDVNKRKRKSHKKEHKNSKRQRNRKKRRTIPSLTDDTAPKSFAQLMEEVASRRSEPASVIGVDDDDIYNVESIREMMIDCEDKVRYYLVKWEGYPEEANTWEPRENLLDNYSAHEQRLEMLYSLRLEVSKRVWENPRSYAWWPRTEEESILKNEILEFQESERRLRKENQEMFWQKAERWKRPSLPIGY